MLRTLFIASFFIAPTLLFSQNVEGNLWMSINGEWTTQAEQKTIFSSKQKVFESGYHELINSSAIASIPVPEKPSTIQATLLISEPMKTGSCTLFFSCAPSYMSFYAFRLSGSDKKIMEVEAIREEPIDSALPYTVKNNFKIIVLSSEKIDLDYGKKLSTIISIKRKTAEISINGKKILSFSIESDFPDGSFGFAHKGNKLSLSDIKVLSGKKVIFEDKAEVDRIKRYSASFKKENK